MSKLSIADATCIFFDCFYPGWIFSIVCFNVFTWLSMCGLIDHKTNIH
jgi:hypothetical protein